MSSHVLISQHSPESTLSGTTPLLSIIVIIYKMSRQAMNTLLTLSAQYQQNIDEHSYEVIVVENTSSDNVNPQDVIALGNNYHYFLRQENSVSPVGAINFGVAQARGQYIGLMIDGASMVTPRVLHYCLLAFHMDDNALIAVPSFNLGPKEQHYHVSNGYDEKIEQQLLANCDWQENGYNLYAISSIGGAIPFGYFHPMMESNCLFVAKKHFLAIGGADVRFQLPGGGAVNLHIYRSLGLLPTIRLIILPGEASFHQFHGGVTTAEKDDREDILKAQHEQLQTVWSHEFHSLRREPMLFGAVTAQAIPFLQYSCEMATKRFNRFAKNNDNPWPDDSVNSVQNQQTST